MSILSNLSTTTNLGTPILWPLFWGSFIFKEWKMGRHSSGSCRQVVVIRRYSQVWLYLFGVGDLSIVFCKKYKRNSSLCNNLLSNYKISYLSSQFFISAFISGIGGSCSILEITFEVQQAWSSNCENMSNRNGNGKNKTHFIKIHFCAHVTKKTIVAILRHCNISKSSVSDKIGFNIKMVRQKHGQNGIYRSCR
jgi:hypothetical protein